MEPKVTYYIKHALISTTLFIILSIQLANSYTLVGNTLTDLTANDASFASDAAGWTLSAYVNYPTSTYICNGNYLMGGYNIMAQSYGSYFQRIYGGLPNHNLITLTFDFQPIDSWDGSTGAYQGDHFEVAFDTDQYKMWTLLAITNGYAVQVCGSSYPDFPLLQVYLTVPHIGPSLTFKVINYLDQGGTDESFGFRNIKMVFSTITSPTFAFCGVCDGSPLPNNACPCSDPSNMYMNPLNSGHCLCNNSQYLYWDGICGYSCPSPLSITDFHGQYYCNYPCSTSQYLYWNGSCETSCPSPLITRVEHNRNFCDPLPCSFIGIYCLTCAGSKCLSCTTDYLLYIGDNKCYTNDACPSGTSPNSTNCVDPVMEGISKAQQLLSGASAIVASVLTLVNFQSPLPFLINALAGTLLYMKYMSLIYPPRLQYILDQPDSPLLSIKYISAEPEELDEAMTSYSLEDNFERNGISSSFLINFWPLLMNLLLICTAIVIVYAFEPLTRHCKLINAPCRKLKEALKWNYLLTFFAGCYGNISFYSSFEFKTVFLRSSLEILSFNLCVIFNIILVIVSVKIFLILRTLFQQRKSRTLGKLKQEYGDFQAVFEDYKNASWIQQSFFLIYCFRFYLFYSVLAYLFEYPLLQAIIINLQSLGFLFYLIFKRPLISKFDLAGLIVLETVIEIVHACVFGLAIINHKDPSATIDAVNLGDVMVLAICLFIVVQCLYMLIQSIKMVISFFRSIRKTFCMKQKRPKAISRKNIVRTPESNINIDQGAIVDKQEDAMFDSPVPLKRDIIQPMQKAAFLRRPQNHMSATNEGGRDIYKTNPNLGMTWNKRNENRPAQAEPSSPSVQRIVLPVARLNRYNIAKGNVKERPVKTKTVHKKEDNR